MPTQRSQNARLEALVHAQQRFAGDVALADVLALGAEAARAVAAADAAVAGELSDGVVVRRAVAGEAPAQVCSTFAVPVGDGAILEVAAEGEAAFAAADRDALGLLAVTVAAALERAHATRRRHALDMATAAIASARDPDAGFTGALRALGAAFGWSAATFWADGFGGLHHHGSWPRAGGEVRVPPVARAVWESAHGVERDDETTVLRVAPHGVLLVEGGCAADDEDVRAVLGELVLRSEELVGRGRAEAQVQSEADSLRAVVAAAERMAIADSADAVRAIVTEILSGQDPAAPLVDLVQVQAAAAFKRLELIERLDAAARTDGLTGVANRRTWDEVLPVELARARRRGEPVALAMLDIDHFKTFNDTRGHQAGDALLREVACRWSERLRPTDVLARYGGEEFAVLLVGCDDPVGPLERLRAAMPDAQTCSVGVAEWDGVEDPAELTARADAALYAAKRAGRNRLEVAAPAPAV